MSINEMLEETRRSPAVAFHKFVLLTKRNGADLFCFFEGYDSPYYSLRIKTLTKGNYHPIICGSKKSLVELRSIIRSNVIYSKYRCAFFVDKDFDESIKLKFSDIYETPCYSVENFYVTEYTLVEILKNEFHLIEGDTEFDLAVDIFRTNRDQFNEKTFLFNAWYACLKEKCDKLNVVSNASLNDKLPKGFIMLKIGSIQSDYDLQKIKDVFPMSLDVSDFDIRKKFEENKDKDPSCWFRGKFEMWFFYEFLKFLISDANDTKCQKIIKRRTKFSVDKAQILSQLSHYAVTPVCLENYLQSFN